MVSTLNKHGVTSNRASRQHLLSQHICIILMHHSPCHTHYICGTLWVLLLLRHKAHNCTAFPKNKVYLLYGGIRENEFKWKHMNHMGLLQTFVYNTVYSGDEQYCNTGT